MLQSFAFVLRSFTFAFDPSILQGDINSVLSKLGELKFEKLSKQAKKYIPDELSA
jgi:hypothetical protein